MPIHLARLGRRRFLLGAAACLLPRRSRAAADPNRWALLADTHVAADPGREARGVNMAQRLRSAAAEITLPGRRPAGMILAGDCAFDAGLPGDYETLAGLLKPFREADIPLHLALGNHDHRDHLRAGLAGLAGPAELLEMRHVSVIEAPRARWYVLDTLDRTNVTPGVLGEAQRRWLAAALDAGADRPALVVCHHNPQFEAAGGRVSGLVDTAELFAILAPRKQVKAVFFGHTHRWEVRERDGIHLVNLPPVGYVFREADPGGWIDARLTRDGAVLTFRAHDRGRPVHDSRTELRWRGA